MKRASIFLAPLSLALLAGCPDHTETGGGGSGGAATGGSGGGVACAPHWADCNGNPADGCEVSIDTDPGHCGACNIACSYRNAAPACVSGMCEMDTCFAGFGDCNNDPADGCESDLNTDDANCGGCGIVCGMIAHCKAGVCVTAS